MKRNTLTVSLIVLGAAARLLPHPPNFTPVGALALFAGGRLRGWQAWLVPAAVILVTNPLLGLLYGFRPFSRITLVVMAAMTVNVAIGRLIARSQSGRRIAAAALACSVQFFLATNFGAWLVSHAYPPTLAGLAMAYAAGLPFFAYTVAGDLAYSALLFGLHAWAGRRLVAEAGGDSVTM